MEEIINKINNAINSFSTIRVDLTANGNSIFTDIFPVEYVIEGTVITMTDPDDNHFSINCENIEFDEISNFYILKSDGVEAIVEFESIN